MKKSLDRSPFVWYIIYIMNNKVETLINNHILRLQAEIDSRDQDTFSDGTRKNRWHADLDKVDLKNIASLREGRVPQYGAHMEALYGSSIDMAEFRDLTEELTGVDPWPADPCYPV